ncbi:GGDEF domain-containing protein [Pseudoalteromonas sp. M8]|uniref:GGDEF domain-containing protein n=1 Tax=Pseudoalteromonas sp. M8 TaxID=2692624 RepID=UPI001BA9D3FB|nr:GGDEF domain-containing protein [Pseudoalteromonas sp. M8]QUI68858.1 diguanylate cyclase [Pseudoalteromonas sp. M8]
MANSNKSSLAAVFDMIKLESNAVYLQKKFLDHRIYTVAILLLLIPLGFIEGLFDYKNQPTVEDELFHLRLYLFLLIIPAISVYKTKSFKITTIIITLTTAALAFHAVKAAEILGEEALHTVTTVAVFPFLIFFILISVSVYIQITFLVLAFLFVIYFKLAQSTSDVLHDTYFQIAFQYSLAALFVMLIFSWSYYRRFCLELALEKGSKTDPLTGVANRRHFDIVLKTEVNRNARSGSNCALILLDIDHFKRINDTYGHPTGDRVICCLADTCVTLSRQIDLVARLGGEEFAIILPNTKIEDAKNLAERIRLHVENIEVKSDAEEPVKWTISLGISAWHASQQTNQTKECSAEKMIQQADTALYEAKNSGRNNTVLYK